MRVNTKAHMPDQTNKGESYYQRTRTGEVQWEVPVGHTVTIMYVCVCVAVTVANRIMFISIIEWTTIYIYMFDNILGIAL